MAAGNTVFLVVADPNYDAEVQAVVSDGGDCLPVRPGVWLVRSKHDTSSATAKALGIASDKPALVVNAKFISGWAESDIIEQLQVWDES